MKIVRCLLFFIWLALPRTLYAENAEKLVEFNDWAVYKSSSKWSKDRCYTLSKPVKTKVFNGIRNTPFIAITKVGNHKTTSFEYYTITVRPGFFVSEHESVVVFNDFNNIRLKPYKTDYAITYSSQQDAELIKSFIKEKDNLIKVKSTSKFGNVAIDIYSTKGLKEAIFYMAQNCNF